MTARREHGHRAGRVAAFVKRPFAHRGLHDRNVAVSENSMAAFAAAIERGCGIECDVQASSDGQLVVFHDYDLMRMTGNGSTVSTTTAARLAEFRLRPCGSAIPAFDDLLSLVRGRVPLLVEIKNEKGVGPLEAAVASALDGYDGPVAIQSFNPMSLRWFARNRPEVLRGQLSCDFRGRPDLAFWKRLTLEVMAFNVITRPDFVAYEIASSRRPWFRFYRRWSSRPLLLWTAETDDDLAYVRSLGATAIFETDDPNRMS